jgi:signal transduction histidine kinase
VIKRLQEDAVTVTQTYAELIRAAISENMNYSEMNVIFHEIIQKSNNPIIITDTTWEPIMWKNVVGGPFYNRYVISSHDTSGRTMEFIRDKINEYKRQYEPKPLFIRETQSKIGYLVFGNSSLIHSLTWMPFLEIGIIFILVVFTFLVFDNLRITERSNLWVGLAKETAHQLGTPISSLMGWVEYLRSYNDSDADIDSEMIVQQLDKICDDMNNDLIRLRKITARFSQIGSIPALKPVDINDVLEDAMEYFKMRLPLLKKKIEIRPNFSDVPMVEANRDLIEWVFENLIKNSIDAIVRNEGYVEISTEYSQNDHRVRIYNRDNGKGISWEEQKKIFAPGYTTKKRGWGLGLTLTKRIVEDYHKGKIFVSWSQRDKGTVFCIELPIKKKQ